MQKRVLKNCDYCGDHLVGRSDKKYCNNYCRGAYNNQLKSAANNYIRNVNHALGKNRRILVEVLGNLNSVKVKTDYLKERGFIFKYITHQYNSSNGKTYFYCYDYGYTVIATDVFLIVKQNAG